MPFTSAAAPHELAQREQLARLEREPVDRHLAREAMGPAEPADGHERHEEPAPARRPMVQFGAWISGASAIANALP